LVISGVFAGADGLRLAVGLADKLGRSPVWYPDLDWSQTLSAKTIAVGLDSLGG